MDAKELTVKYHELSDWRHEAIKQIEFLEQENEKIRLQLNDLMIDVKMLQERIRRREL